MAAFSRLSSSAPPRELSLILRQSSTALHPDREAPQGSVQKAKPSVPFPFVSASSAPSADNSASSKVNGFRSLSRRQRPGMAFKASLQAATDRVAQVEDPRILDAVDHVGPLPTSPHNSSLRQCLQMPRGVRLG